MLVPVDKTLHKAYSGRTTEISGNYKLARVADGRCHFAQVTLTISSLNGTDASEHDDDGMFVDWLEAARHGARDGVTHLLGSAAAGVNIVIDGCDGTVADTTSDAVWCAAFLAVVAAVRQGPAAEPSFDTARQRWFVRFDDGSEVGPTAGI